MGAYEDEKARLRAQRDFEREESRSSSERREEREAHRKQHTGKINNWND